MIFFVAGLLPIAPCQAGTLDFLDGIALGAGWNQGANNDANEKYMYSIKSRDKRWEYGLDFCRSEIRGGNGKDNFAFIWVDRLEELGRPKWQDYGIFVGYGAGFFMKESNLFDWPAGPFVIIGWDYSHQAGLEGKVGYFGENYWGTAVFYWYFD